jgi:hypothetical protein
MLALADERVAVVAGRAREWLREPAVLAVQWLAFLLVVVAACLMPAAAHRTRYRNGVIAFGAERMVGWRGSAR